MKRRRKEDRGGIGSSLSKQFIKILSSHNHHLFFLPKMLNTVTIRKRTGLSSMKEGQMRGRGRER